MATLNRIRVEWSGLTGLPGISTFYVGSADSDISELVTFFTAIRGLFPSGLSWTIPSDGDQIDDATGALTGTWIGTGGGTVTANAPGLNYAAGVGARVRWLTPAVVGGRRLRGATFLTHLASTNYDAQGTILSAALTTIQTAATALATSGSPFMVWHRPVNGVGGSSVAMNAAIVPDRVAWLRTRKI